MGWRDRILKEFTPGVARLTVAADPDGLLTEEGILEGIRARGFDLVPYEDPIAFRYAYESRYRSHWDRGEMTELVVVLRTAAADLRTLPYDLLQAGRRLAFSLGDLFPHLSYPVVAGLDRSDLDALFQAQAQYKPGRLGDNATRDFVLRHVFEVAPELIKQPVDLVRLLLRRHYRGQRVPPAIDARLIHLLRQNAALAEWPLEAIVPDRDAFFAFLQERWPLFLDRLTAPPGRPVHEVGTAPLEYPGPAAIPFDDGDVRVYLDNLFADGLLKPVRHKQASRLATQWVSVGLRIDPDADRRRHLDALTRSIGETLPGADAKHQDWLAFAQRWAELVALCYESDGAVGEEATKRLQGLQAQVDPAFLAWVQTRYAGLHNQPVPPAVMVHHVPRVLATGMSQGTQAKVALVVLDGLALDQWVTLRGVLTLQWPGMRLREGAAFAWLPTVTPVSRQALFAGRVPLYFPDALGTTSREAGQWARFWQDQGLTPVEIAYARGLGESADLAKVEEMATHPKVRVLGLVVDKVDKIMHGMELGTAGMHNQVRQWAGQGFLAELLDLLLGSGFAVWLTSDHGNIEAVGCGSPSEGATADVRGARVRVYPSQALRSVQKERFPEAIEWPSIGLPEGYLPLLAPGRSAFAPEGKKIIAHGGASLDELVVPLVRVEMRGR